MHTEEVSLKVQPEGFSEELPPERVEVLLRQVNNLQTKEQSKEDANHQGVPYSKLYCLADKQDKSIMIFGWIMALIAGAGLPSFVFLIGFILDAMGPDVA